jgi:hypothetical protein
MAFQPLILSINIKWQAAIKIAEIAIIVANPITCKNNSTLTPPRPCCEDTLHHNKDNDSRT